MNTKDIRNALKSRLVSANIGPNRAHPNVEPTGGRPFFEMSFTGIDREGGTLKGNEILSETGQFTAVVVVDQGGGEDDALDYADAVAALFPEGQRITITDGEIVIRRPAEIRGGYPTDADYRVPVAVFYRAKAD
ncbi:phage tail terminator-like protein [Roseovarius sp. MMSF_3281]|uniref:phage tail terminator-like protein n=1 Tax=Roseovarius sp. MMSF_3281 TaxID=3046694 RepID=UPI00273D1A6F|nr:phage tail terminator-like protein [Roseovarius sp. MMSF_3281]